MGFRSSFNGLPPSSITAELLADNSVTGTKLTADAIDGKTITGAFIRTAATGKRWELSSTPQNRFNAFSGLATETAPGGLIVDTGVAAGLSYSTVDLKPPNVGFGVPSLNFWAARAAGSGSGALNIGTGTLSLIADYLATDPMALTMDNNGFWVDNAALPTRFTTGEFLVARNGFNQASFYASATQAYMRDPSSTTGSQFVRCNGTDVTINGPINNTQGSSVFSTTGGLTRAPSANSNTTTAAANVFINSTGHNLARSTSMRAQKLAIEPIPTEQAAALLELDVKTWFDRTASEAYAASLEASDPDERAQLLEDMTVGLRRIPGVVAEDVAAAAPLFATYDSDGDLTGVAYDRIGVAWIPLVRQLRAELDELRAENADLRARVTALGG
jgi:hypothetical protein